MRAAQAATDEGARCAVLADVSALRRPSRVVKEGRAVFDAARKR